MRSSLLHSKVDLVIYNFHRYKMNNYFSAVQSKGNASYQQLVEKPINLFANIFGSVCIVGLVEGEDLKAFTIENNYRVHEATHGKTQQ